MMNFSTIIKIIALNYYLLLRNSKARLHMKTACLNRFIIQTCNFPYLIYKLIYLFLVQPKPTELILCNQNKIASKNTLQIKLFRILSWSNEIKRLSKLNNSL